MSWAIYFLKVAVIQLLAYFGYRLLLEREPLGHWKRAYLLVALILAYLIPFVVVARLDVEYFFLLDAVEVLAAPLSPATLIVQNNSYWSLIVLLTYLAVTVFFLSRLLSSLLKIVREISRFQRNVVDGIGYCPLPYPSATRTFLHWIFYPENDPPTEAILIHERAHARQLHSIDRLLIAVLRAIFWFNPVLILYERAMILNHENLADQAVLQQGYPLKKYQEQLMSALRPKPIVPANLASGLNFNLTKKRFQMMNYLQQKQSQPLLRLFASGCLLVALTFCFGQTAYAQVPPPPPPVHAPDVPPPPPPVHAPDVPPPPPPVHASDVPPPPPPPPQPFKVRIPTATDLQQWINASEYGIWIDGKRVDNSVLERYSPADFGYYMKSKLQRNAVNYGKHAYQIDLISQAAFPAFKKKMEKLILEGPE